MIIFNRIKHDTISDGGSVAPLVFLCMGAGCVARSVLFPVVISGNVGASAVFGGVWGYIERLKNTPLHGNLYKCVGKSQ